MPWMGGPAFFLLAALSLRAETPLASPTVASSMTSPFTNAIPRASFNIVEGRDPFSPIGYKKPLPRPQGAPVEQPKVIDFKLKITGISNLGSESVATLDTGEIIELGSSYKLKSKDGNASVEYKVLSITENAVVVLYDGKEFSFQLQELQIEHFIEKDEIHENNKP
jgi:hypothetical protein